MSAAYEPDHERCDADALSAEDAPLSSLARDEFHKLCPGALRNPEDGSHAPLGQPRCGDGTNFSFVVSRPKAAEGEEEASSPPKREKVLVELSGGGACWDPLTCNLQAGWLSFPKWLHFVLGKSCSDFDQILCSRRVGETDFTEYNAVLVPYCTQDVHLGDAPSVSYDGGVKGVSTVHHVGAHNVMGTLRWVFENFPDPSDVVLTGCSAGGTPLPVLYDLVRGHYAAAGKEVNVKVLADSPVFLTPSTFLTEYMPNWNVRTVFDEIGFDFDLHANREDFSSKVLYHALERSNNSTDKFGYVTHDEDAVSLMYYKMMGGGAAASDIFGRDRRRRLSSSSGPSTQRELDANDITSLWWSEMDRSLSLAKEDHENFDAFVMDGGGHCTSSMAVPLGYPGFEEWVAAIVKEGGSIPSSSADVSVTSPDDSAGDATVIVSAGVVGVDDAAENDSPPSSSENVSDTIPGESDEGSPITIPAGVVGSSNAAENGSPLSSSTDESDMKTEELAGGAPGVDPAGVVGGNAVEVDSPSISSTDVVVENGNVAEVGSLLSSSTGASVPISTELAGDAQIVVPVAMEGDSNAAALPRSSSGLIIAVAIAVRCLLRRMH